MVLWLPPYVLWRPVKVKGMRCEHIFLMFSGEIQGKTNGNMRVKNQIVK